MVCNLELENYIVYICALSIKTWLLQNNTYKPKALVIVSGREKYIYDLNSKIQFFD